MRSLAWPLLMLALLLNGCEPSPPPEGYTTTITQIYSCTNQSSFSESYCRVLLATGNRATVVGPVAVGDPVLLLDGDAFGPNQH